MRGALPPWEGCHEELTLFAACLLGLLFDPEGGGSKLLRNVGKFLPEDTPLNITTVRTSDLNFHYV
jgi:hypothetical protein